MGNRREKVPFDPYHFEKRAREGHTYSSVDTFRQIYSSNHWGGAASISGEGASSDQTQHLQTELSRLLEMIKARVFLDAPCGDFGWMNDCHLPIASYIGGDIVPELITRNQEMYGAINRQFMVLDITRDQLPFADLLFCRDCFVHLSFADIRKALSNIKRSRVRYLITTTFPECKVNEDITTGDWRVLNLEQPPFNLCPPLRLINEECTEGGGEFRDKSMGLWLVEHIPDIE